MNEDKTDLSATGDEKMEARIVACILGQASTFEAEELEKFCAENPEWRVYQRRMLTLHGLLQEAIKEETSAEWKLADEKRAKLEPVIGTADVEVNQGSGKRAKKNASLWQGIARIAAVVAIITVLALLATDPLLKQKHSEVAHTQHIDSFDAKMPRKPASGPANDISFRMEIPNTEAASIEGENRYANPSSETNSSIVSGIVAPPVFRSGDLAQSQTKQTESVFEIAPAAAAAPAVPLPGSSTPLLAQDGKGRERGLTASDSTAAISDPFSASGGGQAAGITPVIGALFTDDTPTPAEPAGSTGKAGEKLGDRSGGAVESGGFNGSGLGLGLGFGGGGGGGGGGGSGVNEDLTKNTKRLEGDLFFYNAGSSDGDESDERAKPSDQSVDSLAAGADAPADSASMFALGSIRKGQQLDGKMLNAKSASAPQQSQLLYNTDAVDLGVVLPTKEEQLLRDELTATESNGRGIVDFAGRREALADRQVEMLEKQNQDEPTNAPKPAVEKLAEAEKKMVEAETQSLLLPQTPELSAAQEAYSTFSLRVSDASFKLAQAALAKNQRPAPASVRVEEFYNAFDYGDPVPAKNEPVACALEQSAHPFLPSRNLVRVSMRTAAAGRSAGQPLQLTVLIDNSGSMGREDRAAVLEKSVQELTTLLTENDRVSIVSFARTSRLLAENIAGNDAAQIRKAIIQTPSDGGTNLEEALKLSQQISTRNQVAGAQNRILLMTDGAANLGNANPDRLADSVKTMRQSGLAFDIIGIGTDGLNDAMLLELARNGNGRYYVVNSAADARENFARQLAGAFRPAAENVKVQVRFNPQRVGKYKLIGFEKDRLKTEDFRNDSVDAAELAAAEAGNAIYQVELLPEGSGDIGEVSVRFRNTATRQMVENKWTMNYDAAAPAFDRGSPSMQLAGLAMLTAEKLRGGPLADMVNFREMAATRDAVRQYYRDTVRVAQLLEMIRQLE